MNVLQLNTIRVIDIQGKMTAATALRCAFADCEGAEEGEGEEDEGLWRRES